MAELLHACAQVNLGSIAHNVQTLKQMAGTAMMTVVKADGYGHGAVAVARTAREAGADWLGVATPAEAEVLRTSGDTGPLICWLATPSDDLSPLVAADVDLSSGSADHLDQVVEAGLRAGRTPAVHLKVDTGMTRGGALPGDWRELFRAAAAAQRSGRLFVRGIWSHLACADMPGHPATPAALTGFEQALAEASDAGLQPELRHLANTPGTIAVPDARYDLVRCGIGSYGLSPFAPEHTPQQMPELRPAMRLRAEVPLVKRIGAGWGISYGHTYVTESPTTLALLPLGYADGLPRGQVRAPVQVAGVTGRIAGRVCMDQCMVDLGHDSVGIEAGAEAIVFGPGIDGEPTADDWAAACSTINYEIVTRIGARVPRSYADSWDEFAAGGGRR